MLLKPVVAQSLNRCDPDEVPDGSHQMARPGFLRFVACPSCVTMRVGHGRAPPATQLTSDLLRLMYEYSSQAHFQTGISRALVRDPLVSCDLFLGHKLPPRHLLSLLASSCY